MLHKTLPDEVEEAVTRVVPPCHWAQSGQSTMPHWHIITLIHALTEGNYYLHFQTPSQKVVNLCGKLCSNQIVDNYEILYIAEFTQFQACFPWLCNSIG